MKTNQSPRLTLVQGGVGVVDNGSAYTTSGCESLGGITSRKTQSQALSELLNDLEKKVEILESRYLEVLGMWITASEHLVRLLPTIIDTTITKSDTI